MMLGYLVVAIVALILGFIGGRVYTRKVLKAADLQRQIDDSKKQMEKYREEVSTNLSVTQSLMAQMKQNYDKIVEQMEQTTKLLEQPKATDNNIQYFGTDATEQFIASNSANGETPTHKHEQPETQPSDFSGSGSHLFDNAKDKK